MTSPAETGSGEPSERNAALELFRALDDQGDMLPQGGPLLAEDMAFRIYREMKRLRLLDARLTTLQRQGRIGFYGSCTGQEVAPVVGGLVFGQNDWIFPALREASAMLVRGVPLRTYVAQVFGNRGDRLKGRQMPSHMSARSAGVVSWSSCIGPQLPHAVGAAWAAKLRGDATVVLGFLGDGATSTPDFHAALNFAGVFHLPVVFACQNNQYALSVPVGHQTASETLAAKASAYGIPASRVDGNDAVAVHRTLSDAAANARSGHGPMFVELVTYRMAPHSTSDDPTRYRTQDEVDAWAAKDPILRLGRHLRRRGLLSDTDDARIFRDLNAEIDAAIAEVEPLAPPDRLSMFDDVYADLPWHLREEREQIAGAPEEPTLEKE